MIDGIIKTLRYMEVELKRHKADMYDAGYQQGMKNAYDILCLKITNSYGYSTYDY